MKGKKVKESSLVTSHLMLIGDAGNMIINKDSMPIGMVHGGKIMTLMDEIAGMVGARHSGRHVATAVIEKMQFLAPVFIGNRIILKASVNYAGKTSMEIGIRIEAENLITRKTTHTNSCYLVAVAIDEKGMPTNVPEIIPESDDEKRRYADAEKRDRKRRDERENN